MIALDKLGDRRQSPTCSVRGVADDVLRVPARGARSSRAARRSPGTDEVDRRQAHPRALQGRSSSARRFELKKNRPVKVVGVFEAGGSSFESEVWADSTSVRTSFGREGTVSSVTRARSSRRRKLRRLQGARRERQAARPRGACARPTYYEKQSEGTAMFISVHGQRHRGLLLGRRDDRRDDHDVRRGRATASARSARCARSASRASRILFSFLLESVLLALVGGVVGALASLAMGSVEFSMMNFDMVRDRVLVRAEPGDPRERDPRRRHDGHPRRLLPRRARRARLAGRGDARVGQSPAATYRRRVRRSRARGPRAATSRLLRYGSV